MVPGRFATTHGTGRAGNLQHGGKPLRRWHERREQENARRRQTDGASLNLILASVSQNSSIPEAGNATSSPKIGPELCERRGWRRPLP